jgi:hypothetical protein
LSDGPYDDRLVELGLIEAEPLASGEIEYRITAAVRDVL